MNRPFVYMNMAMSADGKITSAAREYPKFTSDADRTTMDRLRSEADAVLVGAGTLRADDPPLHIRDPEMQARRAALGKPPGLLAVVVTARVEIDPEAAFLRDHPGISGRILATVEDADPARVAALASRAEVWKLGRGRVELAQLLQRLHARGVERLLVEGGGETNWGFVHEDLLDELHVTLAPTLLGGRDAPTLLEGAGFAMAQRRRLRLLEANVVGDEIYCRWAVVR